ncbi:hypothetical protein GCM10008955_21270 [Deinococcus malanensis]|uniref:Uncharacterized protein n=2 Tax=Deinococcus malanensis TaxID=1706855 RepID=A0ABQ2EUM2_9DEIO|nr:hypothetical protein GCM10008955_21270 [Deinococcus malanensis]
MPATRAERLADRLARYSWRTLLFSIAVGLLGGLLVALFPSGGETPRRRPGPENAPIIISTLGYGLTVLPDGPSLLTGIWDLLHGRRTSAGRRLLVFFGPVVFLAGTEIVPHLLNPCFIALELAGRRFPGMCDYGDWGADYAERWHLLNHTVVGALPFTLIYRRALRR